LHYTFSVSTGFAGQITLVADQQKTPFLTAAILQSEAAAADRTENNTSIVACVFVAAKT
jgi:hypothetical protein